MEHFIQVLRRLTISKCCNGYMAIFLGLIAKAIIVSRHEVKADSGGNGFGYFVECDVVLGANFGNQRVGGIEGNVLDQNFQSVI